MKNIWRAGIFGVVTGDALGCPVQFESRETVATHPVTGMRGHGSFNLPAGSWTDDSSLTLALLDSLCQKGCIDPDHIMRNFVDWLDHGAFTPYGYAYDIGYGTETAILEFKKHSDPLSCGGTGEDNNGNGSLMRIIPACLFCYRQGMSDEDAVRSVHLVSGLTHAHLRAKIACGLYFFMIRSVLDGQGSLTERLQAGLDHGFAYYESAGTDAAELAHYDRLRNLAAFAEAPAENISSSGYVLHTLEAAVWTLTTTDSFEENLLKAVNLGRDTDTVGAITGGLAALYYGHESIPEAWLRELKKREWIEELCEKADTL